MRELAIPFVGPGRAAWQYRIGEVARRGSRVAFGSDWPGPARPAPGDARGVAYVNHEDDVAGTLAPGMLADVAVLTQDLYAISASGIGDTTIALTVASGQVVPGSE